MKGAIVASAVLSLLASGTAFAGEKSAAREKTGSSHLPSFLRHFPWPGRAALADLAALEWARSSSRPWSPWISASAGWSCSEPGVRRS
jgi:hypothetical protein